MEYFWSTLGVLLGHFWTTSSTPSESRFDDCSLVFVTKSACCEPCNDNEKLNDEHSPPCNELLYCTFVSDVKCINFKSL